MCTHLASVALFGMHGIKFQSGAPVPSYYEMTLESLDGCEDLVTNITVERNGEMIDMHIEESVPPNSLWRASILAYGCESDRIVTNYELSKFYREMMQLYITFMPFVKRYPRSSEFNCGSSCSSLAYQSD